MAKLVTGENDLQTWCENNGEWGQRLMEEWVGQYEDGTPVAMDEISFGSRKRVKWKCQNGHEYIANIVNRAGRKSGCRMCADLLNSKKAKERSLVVGENDLLTWCNHNQALGERIITEWTGVEIVNGIEMTERVEPWEVTCKSGRIFLWRCANNHVWKSSVHNRTFHNAGCSKCSVHGTSYTEQLIYQSLKKVYPDCINGFKDRNGLEFDIVIPSEGIYIEYSPEYTHAHRKLKDEVKKQKCIDNDIRFLYINDNYIEDVLSRNKVRYYNTDAGIIKAIFNILNKDIGDINLFEVQALAYNFSHVDIEDSKRAFSIYPELLAELHMDNTIDINKLTCGSNVEIRWKCSKCNMDWILPLGARIRKKTSCPFCGYSIFTNEYVKNSSPKVLGGYNDLATLYPELAKEWHIDNELRPDQIRASSHKDVRWICTNCGYGSKSIWKSSVNYRTNKLTGCPNCGYNWYKAQTGQPQKLKKIKPKSKTTSLDEFY